MKHAYYARPCASRWVDGRAGEVEVEVVREVTPLGNRCPPRSAPRHVAISPMPTPPSKPNRKPRQHPNIVDARRGIMFFLSVLLAPCCHGSRMVKGCLVSNAAEFMARRRPRVARVTCRPKRRRRSVMKSPRRRSARRRVARDSLSHMKRAGEGRLMNMVVVA